MKEYLIIGCLVLAISFSGCLDSFFEAIDGGGYSSIRDEVYGEEVFESRTKINEYFPDKILISGIIVPTPVYKEGWWIYWMPATEENLQSTILLERIKDCYFAGERHELTSYDSVILTTVIYGGQWAELFYLEGRSIPGKIPEHLLMVVVNPEHTNCEIFKIPTIELIKICGFYTIWDYEIGNLYSPLLIKYKGGLPKGSEKNIYYKRDSTVYCKIRNFWNWVEQYKVN